MNGPCCCLQGVEKWTSNKVIKAERMTLTQLAAVILMDRGIIMTPRLHLDKLAVLTVLLGLSEQGTCTGKILQVMDFCVLLHNNALFIINKITPGKINLLLTLLTSSFRKLTSEHSNPLCKCCGL